MAIDRKTRKFEMSPTRFRYRIVVTGDDCPPNTHESRVHQNLFLRYLADNQSLLDCGYHVFDRLVISHNGVCWEAVAEAEVDEEPTV